MQDLPSQQLLRKRVNGRRTLVGNNANEGPGFTPQNITTENDLVTWLQLTFPLFTNDDIARVLLFYPSSNATTDSNAPLFATEGDSGPTALNQSSVGTGQQQRADVGPSYQHKSLPVLLTKLCRTSMPRQHLPVHRTGWHPPTTTMADQHTNISTLLHLPPTEWTSQHVSGLLSGFMLNVEGKRG